tara:strand:+ start:1150 stop:1638 length:489 start_codon:yes stop_codon:yes gene_type:complete
MAEFSGKIINAEYVNAEYSIIKVQYDKDGKIFVYHLDVDQNHPDFQALEAEGWDTEKLVEATAESKRMQSAAWNIEVNNAAKLLFAEMKSEEVEDSIESLDGLPSIYDHIVFDEDKDNLFRFKLWALDTDLMKASSKSDKSKLRKAKTILEAFTVIYVVKSK